MKASSGFKKDYYGGALMVIIGLAAAYAATDYHLGSLARMGPGFFPCALGVLLALVGLMIAASAPADDTDQAPKAGAHGPSHEVPDMRGAICIIVAILAFLLLGVYGGLLPATFAIVFISALGDRTNTVKQAVLLALAMSAVAAIVFWWALQLQLPLFRWGA